MKWLGYKTKVISRSFREVDLILKKTHLLQIENKFSPKWVGPYRIKEVLGGGAYKLETLDVGVILCN